MKPTKEQIEKFREDVITELKKLPIYSGKQPMNYDSEIEVVKNCPDYAIINVMQYHTPQEYAEMLIM